MSDFFKSLLIIEGRIGRLRYFFVHLGLCGVFAFFLTLIPQPHFSQPSLSIESFIGSRFFLYWIVPFLALSLVNAMHRAHDLGWSGLTSALLLVPLVSFVFFLILLFLPGQRRENRYGPPPQRYEWVRPQAKDGA